jgi:hypothetical protein
MLHIYDYWRFLPHPAKQLVHLETRVERLPLLVATFAFA